MSWLLALALVSTVPVGCGDNVGSSDSNLSQNLRRSSLEPEQLEILKHLESSQCILGEVKILTFRHGRTPYPVFQAKVVREGGNSSKDSIANCRKQLLENPPHRMIVDAANVSFEITVEPLISTKPNLPGRYTGKDNIDKTCTFTVEVGDTKDHYTVTSNWDLLKGQQWTVIYDNISSTLKNRDGEGIWIKMGAALGPSPNRRSGKVTGLNVGKSGSVKMNTCRVNS